MAANKRLVIHTDSITLSDVRTFEAAAKLLENEYKLKSRDIPIVRKFVKSGIEIVRAINANPKGSLVSLDVVSHGNQGGIHISRKLGTPIKSGTLQRRAHVVIRSDSDRPQDDEQAEHIEESMHGLYTDWLARKGVSYYYNQTYDSSTDTAFLGGIDFSVFADNAFVELHGCRTAETVPMLNTYLKDNFAKQFSDSLPKECIVVGHITNSNPNKNPNGKTSDYRHGRVHAYKDGTRIHDFAERRHLKFKNSSTP